MVAGNLKLSFRWLQVLLWLIFFMGLLLYASGKYGITYSLYSAGIAAFSYLLAVYGNSLFLMPRFFKKGRQGSYLLWSVFFVLAVVLLKCWLEYLLLLPMHKLFFNFKAPHLMLGFLTVVTAFLFGGLLYTAQNYIGLLKKQEQLKARQLASELSLLKQQVQPHFLFNTLNNIYALAYAKSDAVTLAISRLASIMRYFTEAAPAEKVPLQTELDFINNYIDLEQLRMVQPVVIRQDIQPAVVLLPPMLLMPFVENLFKHGIDKTAAVNEASIKLSVRNGRLDYSVTNRLHEDAPLLAAAATGGTGLDNLKKRLDLLYNDGYLLHTGARDGYFEALLEIPV